MKMIANLMTDSDRRSQKHSYRRAQFARGFALGLILFLEIKPRVVLDYRVNEEETLGLLGGTTRSSRSSTSVLDQRPSVAMTRAFCSSSREYENRNTRRGSFSCLRLLSESSFECPLSLVSSLIYRQIKFISLLPSPFRLIARRHSHENFPVDEPKTRRLPSVI
jgi:hypothetical protein